MDDTFMSAVFDKDIASVTLLLNIILGRSDMEAIDVKTQVTYSNLLDRSIRIDVEAKDSSGEMSSDFGDGSHIIYVNASIDDKDTPLSKLMHDFKCKNADDMYYPQLANRVNMIKNTEGGQENMCEIMDKISRKAADEATREKQIQIAMSMLDDGKLSFEDIAKYSGLTLDEVKALAEGKPA